MLLPRVQKEHERSKKALNSAKLMVLAYKVYIRVHKGMCDSSL